MTCAHVVHVALKNVAGVESADVSLNKGLAIVKLKNGNAVSVSQLWELIHQKGYTPKATEATLRGELSGAGGRLQLKVSGTKETLPLSPDPRNPAAYADAGKQVGRTVVVRGVMTPGKDFKATVPLQVAQVK